MRRTACTLGLIAVLVAAAAWGLLLTALAATVHRGDERVRLEQERTVLEYPAGVLGASDVEAFARLAEDGVADLEALVSPGLPLWARRTGRIRFVVSDEIEISRTWGRTVVLPIGRVRARTAPYLHETVHALVPARGDRTWLSEGLACYLESYVAETLRGYDAHVFTRAGDRGIHAAARRTLETSGGKAVLPWVGGMGSPPNLEEDRGGVARPFYVLSHSLAKHVVETAGLNVVVRALVASDPRAFADETGHTDEVWRAMWLKTIGASAPPAAAGP